MSTRHTFSGEMMQIEFERNPLEPAAFGKAILGPEQGMSKYPLGRYRDRIGQNVETVYKKVVQGT